MRESAVLPDQRREAILETLARDGRVVATQLAAALGVSDDTVRRDLDELAASGRVRRVRGGALPSEADTPSRMVDRQERHTPEKERVAARTAELLAGETVIGLAGGSTCLAIARRLATDGVARQVLTTAPDIALALADAPGEVLLAGGRLEPDSRTTVGTEAIDAVRRFRPSVAVLGVCSLHPAIGLTTYCAGEAEVLREQARCAGRLLVATESAKLGSTAAHVVAPADGVAQLVTDDGAPDEELRALRALGVEVVVA
ncbi:DeoR/GlpR family DNA-binding transcription regulator [Baekduia sp. Peel2402]|uniref:DeoR/GlpR family DNA-binding transcription regulator n=1 Tax=Baekduia sp. Peel2402 TaxID=3458296 RepID=UPI00403E548C